MSARPISTLIPLSTLLGTLAIAASPASAETVSLSNNDNHQLKIDLSTLNMHWNEMEFNQAALKVDGQLQHTSHVKRVSPSTITWRLTPSNIQVKATFDRALVLDFTLLQPSSVSRSQPKTLTWFNLQEQNTQELYLPYSEGMRVPTDHPQWIDYLIESRNNSNTTQDLKMPFWTAKQGQKFVSWQLLTPTNNSLRYTESNSKLDMFASHQFTQLNARQPFSVSISLGKDMLDGAKQYRQWRIDNGYATPLTTKLKHNPNITKLIGASQVYLFGSDGISPQDVRNWWGLHRWYFNHSGLSISKQARKELASLIKGEDWLTKYHKQVLVDAINQSLNSKFPAPTPSLANNGIETQYLAAQNKKNWLEQQASSYLIDSSLWGQAISKPLIDSLQSAGISRLWLGLDNWMPAFYQPDAVKQAKQAGYLVGTYDSYNTAIPVGVNDNWLTAQLPEELRTSCAIEQADGSKKKGFRNNGFYLNPECHQDYVQERIADIVKFGGFDSLFLDVDATAMAREDYHLGSNESQMLASFNHRMNKTAASNGIVLGSEDGNSLTTAGIAFAHGLETIGFGWSDKEMKSDTSSPYFLGRWYPDHKPDFFFKSAQVKEPYKTLLFSPEFRVPLYQTVFHDEVINSHHWHSDSLKFSDVKVARDLTAMLYNVPAMVHLSRDEAETPNSPRIKELKHYELGYKPIHQQLWDKQLVGFTWLDTKGEVQRTEFSDGSKIIANFSATPYQYTSQTIAPHSILGLMEGQETLIWKPLAAQN
ncbi:glycosyl hydrolase [Vibrio sp. T187]|uniref:glycoside hydrolase n=1 Tax=Vibrio TaxID=662 RepID=UPI0010CA01BA|nr:MULTISPECIES: glycoside hydrolase [Vibrio]MBW3696844.1 glycosyl hydrolase [Vibrio sp. T187]